MGRPFGASARVWLALAACAIGACDDAVAIEVVVPKGIEADQIDLFIALDPCEIALDREGMVEACPFIGSDVGRANSDQIYFHDAVLRQPANGPGSYQFRLEKGSRDIIPLLVAVSRQNGKETGAVVFGEIDLSAGSFRARGVLEPHASVATAGQGLPVVHIWNSDDEQSVCVALERSGNVPLFVVDPVDPDCDGLTDRDATGPTAECDPLVYKSQLAAADISCTFHEHGTDPTSACLLGASGCVDGVGSTRCGSTGICVPTELCSCPDGIGVQACSDQLRVGNTPPKLLCRMQAMIDGTGTLVAGCDGADTGTMKVDLDTTFDTHQCGQITFAPPDAPSTLDVQQYRSALDVVTSTGDTMKFEVRDQVQNCQFGLTWDAGARIIPGEHFKSSILLEVKDRLGEPRSVLLEVKIVPVSCGAVVAVDCALDTSNSESRLSVHTCTQ